MGSGVLAGKRGAVFGVANDRSIAWGCAQVCAEAGASLAFNYLGDAQEKRVRSLVDESMPGAPCIPCDVSSDDDIDAFFAALSSQWDGLDFLIHSVAYADRSELQGRFVDTNRDNFSVALDISAYSLVALAKRAAPMFGDSGSIISMSYYGAEKVMPKYNVMGVAKAALEACTRYLAADLGPDGIRVNSISAGPVRTLSSSAVGSFRHILKINEATAPMRRNITPTDVGNAALYLASDLSSGVTGEVMHVDGGYNVIGMFANEETGIPG